MTQAPVDCMPRNGAAGWSGNDTLIFDRPSCPARARLWIYNRYDSPANLCVRINADRAGDYHGGFTVILRPGDTFLARSLAVDTVAIHADAACNYSTATKHVVVQFVPVDA